MSYDIYYLPPDPSVKLPPDVKSYLSGSQFYKEGATGPVPKSISKLFQHQLISKTEIADYLEKMKKAGKLPNLQDFDFANASLSQQEIQELEMNFGINQLWHKKGPLEELLNIEDLDGTKYRGFKDKILSNGKTLLRIEQVLLHLFTDYHYLIINGTLDQDETSLNMWMEERFAVEESESDQEDDGNVQQIAVEEKIDSGDEYDADVIEVDEEYSDERVLVDEDAVEDSGSDQDENSAQQEYIIIKPELLYDEAIRESMFEEAQSYVPAIAKGLASALNKLPLSDSVLYRGDAMREEDLQLWRKGKFLLTTKFFSCTSKVETAEFFAMKSAVEYINDTKVAHKPVLYLFQSSLGKDIHEYSLTKKEKERIYIPGQLFSSIEVDEKTVPGLAIIYLVEVKSA